MKCMYGMKKSFKIKPPTEVVYKKSYEWQTFVKKKLAVFFGIIQPYLIPNQCEFSM